MGTLHPPPEKNQIIFVGGGYFFCMVQMVIQVCNEKLKKSGGSRSSSQTLAETGCTAPSSVEIVIKPCT